MAKETLYFQHDFNARNHEKLAALINDHGPLGYGVFWMLVEVLHEDLESAIEYEEKKLRRVASQFRLPYDVFRPILDACINTYELFRVEDDFLVSDRVMENKNYRVQLKEKRRRAGKIGGMKRTENQASASNIQASACENQASAKHLLQANKQTQAYNRTEQDIKEKKSKEAFTPPSLEEVKTYFIENGYTDQAAKKAFDYYSVANWKDSKDNKVKNWKQKMQGVWFKPENAMQSGIFNQANQPNSFLKKL